MKKLSAIFDHEEKSNYETTVEIILENGAVVEGVIKLRELNESFAKEVSETSVKAGLKIQEVKFKNIEKK